MTPNITTATSKPRLTDELVFYNIPLRCKPIRDPRNPTPEQIEEACKKIQEKWTKHAEEVRRVIKPVPFEFPLYQIETITRKGEDGKTKIFTRKNS